MLAAIRALGFAFVVAGCASGTVPATGGDDDVPAIDAPTTQADARQVSSDAPPPMIDAPPPPPDAFVFQDAAAQPDAPASLFCSANSQCTAAGECCIRLGGPQGFCGPGIPFADECIPQ
jgi:hypothetical protein